MKSKEEKEKKIMEFLAGKRLKNGEKISIERENSLTGEKLNGG